VAKQATLQTNAQVASIILKPDTERNVATSFSLTSKKKMKPKSGKNPNQ
jgi:hypothetical protein